MGSFPPLDSGFPASPRFSVQVSLARLVILKKCLPFLKSPFYLCLFEWHHTSPELFPNLPKLNIAPLGLGIIQCYVL